jgi:hypothetical protein
MYALHVATPRQLGFREISQHAIGTVIADDIQYLADVVEGTRRRRVVSRYQQTPTAAMPLCL